MNQFANTAKRHHLCHGLAVLFLAAGMCLAASNAHANPKNKDKQGKPNSAKQDNDKKGDGKKDNDGKKGDGKKHDGKGMGGGKGGGKGGGGGGGGHMPKGIYVRITPMDSRKGVGQTAVWVRKQHTAQSILKMISELKPDVINRFTTGKQNPAYQVPGSPSMNLIEFYNAAAAAGAPGCMLTAKVHLNDIWSDDYRMAAARNLRDLPITPRMTALDLDTYFDGGGPQEHKRILQQFKNMGYTDLGFNMGAPKRPTATPAMPWPASIAKPGTWTERRSLHSSSRGSARRWCISTIRGPSKSSRS